MAQELTDEELARQLQEELNGVSSNDTQLEADMAFAKLLMEEEEKSKKSHQFTTTTSEKGNTDNMDLNPEDLARHQQEELDLMLAMKLQEGLYQENEFKYKPPPAPATYYPNYMSVPKPPDFVRQKKETSVPPSPECVKRITSDMKELMTSNNRYLHIVPDENDITHIQALIVGPPDTPYAHGFFHFDMLFPHDYPWQPPKVQLVTTDNGAVRFNPNLYANGKVCLSILGTWSGPGWTQVQTLLSTLLSIQSLMNSTPYHNEPGFEHERNVGDIEKYNQCILHETLRVAVCGMMEHPTSGTLFDDVMEEWFLEKYDEYEATCLKLKDSFDGKSLEDPFGERRGSFRYGEILTRLKAIKQKLETKANSENNSDELSPMITSDTPSQNPVISAPSFSDPSQNHVISTPSFSTPPQHPINSTTSQHPVNSTPSQGPVNSTPSQNPVNPTSAPFSPEMLAKQIQLTLSSIQQMPLPSPTMPSVPPDNLQATLTNLLQTYEHQIPPSLRKPTTVKPPSLTELKSAEPDEPSEIVCLICHTPPKDYIILPACQQPHIYCMACASKMIKTQSAPKPYHYRTYNNNKRQNGQTIQCVLCSSSSTLDPSSGLNALRRRKRRKTDDSRMCAVHNEELMFFCMDDMELICYSCASSGHPNHTLEALDDARNKLGRQLDTQVKTMQHKRAKLEEFVKMVSHQQSQLITMVENTQKDCKAKFDALRKLVDEKEKEMNQSVERMYQTKIKTVENEVTRAKERMQQIDQNVVSVADMNQTQDPLEFLKGMEAVEENVRHSCNVVDPESNPKWFQMPPIVTNYIEQTLQALKYKERTYGYGMMEEDEYGEYDE